MNDIKYSNGKFKFCYRTSALIFNSNKSKILLFYGNDSGFYMLPGGKVQEMEKSIDAIRREIKEEIGYDNLNFKLSGISEEIINSEKENIHQITFIYKAIYSEKIDKENFKSIESDWINFKWVNINEISGYKIHPSNVVNLIKECKSINHIVEEI